MADTNHADHPWRKQLNIYLSYMAFYNPLNLALAAVRFDSKWVHRMLLQWFGMVGIAQSMWRTRHWLKRLATGPVERHCEAPGPKYPMISPRPVDRRLIHYGEAIPAPHPKQCVAASQMLP